VSGRQALRERDGPHREGEEPKPMMHGHEKSDLVIVAMKPANKAKEPTAEASVGASAAESVERRAGAKGNAHQQSTHWTHTSGSDPVGQGTVLYVTAEVIRQVAILSAPFIPSSAAQLLDLLAVPAAQRHFSELGGAHRIAPGAKLPPPVPVFPRYVDSEASAQA
jgi:methionyl-tRNA synthetase